MASTGHERIFSGAIFFEAMVRAADDCIESMPSVCVSVLTLPPDLDEDVFHHLAILQLLQNDDLVVLELIAVVSICHSRFSFLC
jgi:hypothetical protein